MKRRLPAVAPARQPYSRRLVAVVVGLAVAGATAGCQVNNPRQTDMPYVPADGVSADLGQLAVRNLVLVGDGTGPVVISGSAINRGAQPLNVQITAQPSATPEPTATTPPAGTPAGGASELQLGPREQVDLATKGLQLTGVTSKPGTLVPVSVTSSTGGTTIVAVPVLPAAEYYSTLTPTPSAT